MRDLPTGSTRLSVVTPTCSRPTEVVGLLANLAAQTVVPDEVLLIDGSVLGDDQTQDAIALSSGLPFEVRYLRAGGGPALQRNAGIDAASGEFLAFIDDDVRLSPEFFELLLDAFAQKADSETGCIAGCLADAPRAVRRRLRWFVHRRLGTLTTVTPGAFDYGSGLPVPRGVSDLGEALRRVDLVGAGCAVWRRAVFDEGLRFADFFRTYAYNEDFHLALAAGRRWKIFDLGAARFHHLEASGGRALPGVRAAHRVINSRFIFVDVVPRRTGRQEVRFWAFLATDLLGRLVIALVSFRAAAWQEAAGHLSGMLRAYRRWPGRWSTSSPLDRSDEL